MFSVGSRLNFLNLLAMLSLALTPVYSAQAESYDVEPSYFPSPEYSPEPEPEESPTYDNGLPRVDRPPVPEDSPLPDESPTPEEEWPTPQETPAVEESPEPEAEETPTPAPPCGEEEGPAAGTGILPFQLAGGETIFEESTWTASDTSGTRSYTRIFEDTELPPPRVPVSAFAPVIVDIDATVHSYGGVNLTVNYECMPNGSWQKTNTEWYGAKVSDSAGGSGVINRNFSSYRNINYNNGVETYRSGSDTADAYELEQTEANSIEHTSYSEEYYDGPSDLVAKIADYRVATVSNVLSAAEDDNAPIVPIEDTRFDNYAQLDEYRHLGPGIWNLVRQEINNYELDVVSFSNGESSRNEKLTSAVQDFLLFATSSRSEEIYSKYSSSGVLLQEESGGHNQGGLGVPPLNFGKSLEFNEDTNSLIFLEVSSSAGEDVSIGFDDFGNPLRQITAEDVSNYSAAQGVAGQFQFSGTWPGIEESPGD